jgi:hypothetical protein
MTDSDCKDLGRRSVAVITHLIVRQDSVHTAEWLPLRNRPIKGRKARKILCDVEFLSPVILFGSSV